MTSVTRWENFFERYRKECERCNGGKAVVIPKPDPQNGDPSGRIDIMFVNERPGPIALRTGYISFDNPGPSAKFFKKLFTRTFKKHKKYRREIFITNTCIWCPKRRNYRNKTPTPKEIRCSIPILKNQIRMVNPKLVVAVGRKALEALDLLYPERHIRPAKIRMVRDSGRVFNGKPPIGLVCHTSQRARLTCNENRQFESWRQIRKYLKHN